MNEQMQTLVGILEKSQWQSSNEILQKQVKHFNALVAHARETVPFYQSHYSQVPNSGAIIADFPIVTRGLLQAAGTNFFSKNIPDGHGAHYTEMTSGSTGVPVTVVSTDFTRLFYDALMLREHTWHNRDLTKKLVSIRWAKRGFGDAPLGHAQTTWGPPINQYKETGPSVFMNVASPTQNQIEGLLTHQPYYILSYPSQFAALATYCLTHNIELPFLHEIRTTGETFTDSYYSTVRKAWPQVKITDVYSSVEIGNIAQQCSQYDCYHVNSENCLLEIVDENNQPCLPHQPGRVLITGLLNYATPFIRYEIGDYAEWGDACACGRGLPVIKKIHGRKRNRITYPNGETRFPYLGEREEFYQITNVLRKFQYVQHNIYDIEVKLVAVAAVTETEQEQFIQLIQKGLGYPFNITLTFLDNIPLGPTGKYEEFISLIS